MWELSVRQGITIASRLDYFLAVTQNVLRIQLEAIPATFKHLSDKVYSQEEAIKILRIQNHEAQCSLREMAVAMADLNNSLVYQLGASVTARRDTLLTNLKNGTEDSTFTSLRYATIAAEDLLDHKLLAEARKEIDAHQPKTYGHHAQNLNERQLEQLTT